jgi:glycosidase/fibronectin type 3 domain-containing protein
MGAYKRIALLGFALLLIAIVGSSIPVLAAGNDNNIEWNELGHDSRDSLYRYPTGAVPTGTPIRLRIRAADNDLTGAAVRVWNDRLNTSTNYPMSLVAENVLFAGDPIAYEFWEVTLPASNAATVYWYRFIVYDGSDTNYYEDDGGRTGGWGQVYDSSPDNSWQLTIYDATFSTPSWVQNAVIYQIFPERFRDGDSSNNPTAGGFFYGNYDTIVRSNTSDWNSPICDPRNRVGSSFTCSGIYSQNFYGGDLQGIIDELAYIDSLGVTAIYLNPIFESPSNHKYDTTDFFHIDDNFGDLATFQTLVAEANARGINIILDGVFNHSSSDSVYFDRYSRWTGTSSPSSFPMSTIVGNDDDSGACESNSTGFTPWYTFFNYTGGGAAPCSDNRDYPKWFGIFDSLPVFQHDYLEVRDYFINNGTNSVAPYWIAQGADGWRLDVAPEIDHGQINDPSDNYWEAFRTAVLAINPNTYIVGEEWGNPTSWTIGGEWDATMNYQQSAAILSFWRDTTYTDNDFNGGSSAGTLSPLAPNGLNERFLNLEERYAAPAFYSMMNLFGSHDTNRALFLLDHNAGSNNTALYNNPNYDWSDAVTRLEGAALIQMTMPGAPTIYYGDEIGLVGPVAYDGSQWQDDPYNRQPYPWLDETGTPYYAHLQDPTTRNQLFSYYQLLINTRNSNAALRTGSFDPLLVDSEVYAYGRKMEDDSSVAVILVNSSASNQVATVDVAGYLPAGSILIDALTSSPYVVSASGEISASVPVRGGILLTMTGFSGRPNCVVNLVAAGASGQVNLSWSAVSNATSYDVYRSRLSGGGYDFIGNTASTNYSDTTVANATTYYYTLIAKNDSTLLESKALCGNEVSATPSLSIGWHVLQWPSTLTHTLSATVPTDTIYGQIYIGGATDVQNTVVAGVLAQVGYGAINSTPDSTWTWFPMSPNAGHNFSQNNDEYQGTLLPTSAGTFWYTVRWSTDGGVTWRYSQLNPPGGDYSSGNVGVLTVNLPTDTIAPSAPLNLAVLATTSSTVTLAWDAHANTDGDLYGFRVYRENTAAAGYSLLTTVTNAAAVQFVDSNVTTNQNYNYYITALDTSLNESLSSNIVNATVEQRLVAVTFTVTVPDPSPGTIQIVGGFNGWNPSDPAYAMTQTSANTWEITFNILDGSTIQYKYTRGSWEKVEKEADGNAEIPDRSLTAAYGTTGLQSKNDTIANWRDPIVTSHSPLDAALNVDPNTTISLVWNQDIPTSPTVSVNGSSGAVLGTWAFDSNSNTSTFTPSAALADGTYTVTASGVTDVAGDVQQVSKSFSFVVGSGEPTTVNLTFSVTVPSHSPSPVYLVGNFGDFSGSTYPNWDAAGILMSETSPNVWEVTIADVPLGTGFAYKYTRGSWETVEKEADGNTEILGGGNRSLTASGVGSQIQNDTVANWRDPYIVSVSPVDGSTGNLPSSTVVITWNQDLPSSLTNFSVLDSGSNSIAGIVSYDSGTDSHSFTPSAALASGNYTVAAAGNTDVNGDAQQIAFGSSFSVSSATYNLVEGNAWFNLQWPPSISYTLGTGATETIYGQIWINGVTGGQNSEDPTPNLIAEIGFGPDGTLPNDPAWQWFGTSFNVNAGNNDEYMGTLSPTVAGSYDYLYRYSGDGGTNWVYGAFNNTAYYNLSSYNPANAGQLTVLEETDTTAPDAPLNLIVTGETFSQIDLAWDAHPNTDGDLFAFELYRDTVLLDTILGPSATSYSDTTVVAGTSYEYYLVAVDTSANPSLPSNTVTGTTPPLVGVAVTFSVTVPLHTPSNEIVYLVGSFPAPYPNWDAAGIPMVNIGSNIWEITLDLTEGQTIEYKYTRGSWETVEKEADGNTEILGGGNRNVTASTALVLNDTVANWRDPYIIGTSPTEGQSNVNGNANIVLLWNQAMPADISSHVSITRANGNALAGTWSYNSTTKSHTFDPSAAFRSGEYLVEISGVIDVNGDTQILDTAFSFSRGNSRTSSTDGSTDTDERDTTYRTDNASSETSGSANGSSETSSGNQNIVFSAPSMSISFADNDNFWSVGESSTVELVFQNLSGQSINGTLELLFPLGITASNASSSHGSPVSFQQYARVLGLRRLDDDAQPQTRQIANGLRLDFQNLAVNGIVTLSATGTVDSSFEQSSALLEARLKVDGQQVDMTSALLVVDTNLIALPATGESPFWYSMTIAASIALGLGFGFSLWAIRKKAA